MRIYNRTIFTVLVSGIGVGSAVAQSNAGSLDPSFGVQGKLMTDFAQSSDLANGVAMQQDGRIVVVGTTYKNNDFSGEDFAIARYNPDGTLDASFGVNGRVTTDFPGLAAVASSVVVQPDGKIVVAGGAFPLFTFLGDFEVVRYNANGSLDSSFGAGGIVTTSFPGQGSYAFDVALQPDGKIVAAGTDFVNFSSQASSDTNFAIARLNADGTPDSSFGQGGQVTTDFLGFNDDAFSILVEPDGKLMAVGSALSQVSNYDFAAARYLANGTLDTTFGTAGKSRTDFGGAAFDQARSAALQPDGKLVAAGFTGSSSGLTQLFALVRWNANGQLDSSFDGDGKATIDFGSFLQAAYKVLLQPDGKIVTVGYPNTESSDSDFLAARCNSNGSLDTTFGIGGKVRTSFGNLNGGANDAVLQPDGKVVAVGFNATATATGVEFAVARYLADPGIWMNKGGALPGAAGAPSLVGIGNLVANASDSLVLSNAAPNALAAFFVSLSSSPVPFMGGILQPFPVVAVLSASTSAAGSIELDFTVPAGIPASTQVWLQWAVQDAGAVQGVALSNALEAIAP